MSTTVTYKGSTLTTVNNQTRTLETAGTYLEDDITLTDVSQGAPTLQTKNVSYTPTESSQSQTVQPDVGYDGLSSVGVSVAAISSTYVGSGVARKSSSDLTVSGDTVTAPAGYYESSASKAVASGTAGTPTATKGAVSNHAVSITPSVTNTTGYITGSTKTGTAVSVSASELVSGTLSITSSGTKDVTNYASASVAAGTEGTPTATKGAVSNHAVSVTPSVTNSAGYISGGTKTGTAVSVSASELVSGSETKTQNGTYDVTNLAELVVNVSGGGGGTPAIVVTTETLPNGADHVIVTGADISDTTAVAADVASGKYFYTAAGVKTEGTASGGGGSITATTGEITLLSDMSLPTTAQEHKQIPGLQLSFVPDFFFLLINRDSFEDYETPPTGLWGVMAYKRTWSPPFASNATTTPESVESDYTFMVTTNVVANSTIPTGYGLSGMSFVGASYYPNFAVNNDGTINVGRWSSASTYMKAGTYRYFAYKL